MPKSKTAKSPTNLLSPRRFSRNQFAIVAGLLILGGLVYIVASHAGGAPLSGYYPNSGRYKSGYYLEGKNYANPQTPSRSVLWFQAQNDGSFRQYNSAPYDTCHWDQLSWKTGTLVYSKTHDQCGSNNNDTVYSPGVKFMPNSWTAGQNWSVNGSSATTYYNHGVVACQGINTWNSKVIGWEQISPGVQGLHIQNNQSTAWTKGSDPSGCAAGYTTKWQENFYLIAGLPVQGLTSGDYGLKREVGGNIDSYNSTGKWDYDVWFDSWNKLP